MFGEHANGGMIEVDPDNVEFPEEKFQSVGETKKDLCLNKLRQDNQLSLGEGENMNNYPITKHNFLRTIVASDRNIVEKDTKTLSALDNLPKYEVQPES